VPDRHVSDDAHDDERQQVNGRCDNTGIVSWGAAAQKKFDIRQLMTTAERNREVTKIIQAFRWL
jgi:hypothetical protein